MMEPKTCSSIILALNLITFFLLPNFAFGTLLSADESYYSRDDFPHDFIFGSATTAYQVEGAANEDGRTPSIWDTFAHDVFEGTENGDVACDGYHKYKEDVKLMVETGLDAYRFSISWSRLIPNGRGPVNPQGLEYYNNLINELISNGIQPHVTLHNFDLPQALDDEYGGWVSSKIVRDFTNYADVCFREFGDRVLYWTTINEPNVFATGGYDTGSTPPRRCSPPFCISTGNKGNSTIEPYLAVHNILLSHSSAARLYKRKYKENQHGFVGISIFTFGCHPIRNTEQDKVACQRAYDHMVGWILEPLVRGDYPVSMKRNAGSRIPVFTSRESEQIKGSADFIGVIHYYNINVTDNSDALNNHMRDFNMDIAAVLNFDLFSNEEIAVTPWKLVEELKKLKLLYGNPPLFIYENGQRTNSNSSLRDVTRVNYLYGYIGAVLDALRDGSNIKGYFVWSFMDVFELLDGYESSFGLYYVDRNDPELKRYPKLSAKWYSKFLKGGSTSIVGDLQQLEKDLTHVSVGHSIQ
ncbi:glycosyl hydrolase 1 [Stylosanthes scabra]|uniref:Glycosyl hydrolase 1 n=1 Tax=Stylosanthes scabra TaxID=79078 RepID=A0ABU6U4D2_9FABA|nr:glycosyl hydrolase 1 [Stylosanthes scabra]